jgi:hypothetical protein
METISLDEFIHSGRALYLLLLLVIFFFAGRWYYNQASGRNYYKNYPVAKVIDDLAVSGELKGKDITKAISDIDLDASPQFQAGQFIQNIKKQ